jgi:hypothetical protein
LPVYFSSGTANYSIVSATKTPSLTEMTRKFGEPMSNVVYLPGDRLDRAASPSMTRKQSLQRFLGRVRDALRHSLAYADVLGRQQREIAALQARVERLERLCQKFATPRQ